MQNLEARFERWKNSPLSWNSKKPTTCWVRFSDSHEVSLGGDSDGTRFQKIADLMLGGLYYPPEVIRFYSPGLSANNPLHKGTRVLQQASLGLGVTVCSMVEIFLSERSENLCAVGYYTTKHHFACGWWKAKLRLIDGELKLQVESLAMPGSLLYWLGLPIARYLQIKARTEAIERFRGIY